MTRSRLTLALTLALAVTPAAAHHSFVAFDAEREALVRGTVTAFEFRNPHTYLFVDVAQPDGGALPWRIEGETRNDLSRNGWREDSVQPGDVVTVRVHPAVDSARRYGRLLSLEKTDGTFLEIPNEDDERGRDNIVPAAGFDGVWLPIQTFASYFGRIEPLANEKARSERQRYGASGALPPNTRCVDMSIPQRLGRAHVYEIETVSEDLILIHGEDDAEPRRIYLDGRPHPETIPEDQQSYTGHSIGRWEDGALVIDTTHFKHQVNGHAGYPSGSRKHLVERFTLSEDKTHFVIDITMEDPEYLTGPVAHRFQWQHSPHIVRLPHSCDRESALGYLEEN